jgi:hypothetical protein
MNQHPHPSPSNIDSLNYTTHIPNHYPSPQSEFAHKPYNNPSNHVLKNIFHTHNIQNANKCISKSHSNLDHSQSHVGCIAHVYVVPVSTMNYFESNKRLKYYYPMPTSTSTMEEIDLKIAIETKQSCEGQGKFSSKLDETINLLDQSVESSKIVQKIKAISSQVGRHIRRKV